MLIWSLFDRSLAKGFAGPARSKPPAERWQDKRREVRGGRAAEERKQIRHLAQRARIHDSVRIRGVISLPPLAMPRGFRGIGGIWLRQRIPKWRATVDENGHYSFAVPL